MRRIATLFGAFGALALVSAATLVSTELSAGAQPSGKDGTFLIPTNDGYGIADCIASNKTCARTVAEAWCQSKGYKTALNYGVADRSDFTGSVHSNRGNGSDMPLVVTCSR